MFIFDPKRKQTRRPVEYPWLLLLLAFVWLWPAAVHRDLWNSESTLYAVIVHIHNSGNAFDLQTYGTIYAANMPVYVWLAAASQKLSAILPMSGYTAARLATTLFIAFSLWAMGGAGRSLLGRYNGRSVVLLLMACPGTMVLGHALDATVMQFAAFCFFIYAVAICKRFILRGGMLMALSWLMAFWAGNLPPLFFLWLMTLLLPCANNWRTRQYLHTIALAFLIALPLLLLLPLLLSHNNPAAFRVWLDYHIFGIFGGFADTHFGISLMKILENLLWFALPAWLVALWTIYRRKVLSHATGWFCLLWIMLSAVILSLHHDLNSNQLFWFLPPFALIAAAGLDDIKRGIAAFFNWFGVMIFGSAAIFLWLLFFAINYGVPQTVAQWASRFNPYFSPDWNYFPMILALSFTPIWIWAVTRRNIRGRQAVTNWAAGSTLIWTIIFSLFLPWTESLKSYRPMAQDMAHSIPPDLVSGSQCMESDSVALLTALDEYSPVKKLYHTASTHPPCRYRLIMSDDKGLDIPATANILWHGERGKKGRETIVLISEQ